jgi:molybdenum cofactor cytidylyltransferase
MADLWGVLLAAGASHRFAADKRLHPLAGGVAMAVRAARTLLHAVPHSVAVVRAADREVADLLAAEGIGIVVNPRPDDGMGASLACGVRAAARATGWVIALADMPFIQAATVATVARAVGQSDVLAAPVFAGHRGHPVAFGRAYFADLVALTGDTGAREVLERHLERLTLIPVDDPGIHRDIDCPADLATRGTLPRRVAMGRMTSDWVAP